MKKALLALGLLSSVSFAQDCSKLFISEYVEGWSNNKALEIYNPTNADIDLSAYFVARYSNGSNAATVANSVQLSGIVPARGVFVGVLDKQDPNGTGQEAPIWDSLVVRADGFFCPVYNTTNAWYWNGNDAILLAKGNLAGLTSTTQITPANVPNFEILDVFGKIGEDPSNGEGWFTQFPYNNNLGVNATADHSLLRKPTVLKGVTANPAFFDPLLEYDSIPAVTYLFDQNGDTITGGSGNPILFGNWFSLGTHDCGCNDLATGTTVKQEMVVYPNPASDGVIYIKNAGAVKDITVYNSLGQFVGKTSNAGKTMLSVQLGDERGVYIVRITETDGSVTTKRVVVK